MSIRITSGLVGARQLDAQIAVSGAQQAHIGTARDELFDQLQIGGVVLDIEQGSQRTRHSRSCAGAIAAGRVHLRQFWLRGRVQLEPEHAARADGAFDADRAAHQLDQPLAHHQADARAFLRAALLPQAVERLEQLRQHFRRQPRAACP